MHGFIQETGWRLESRGPESRKPGPGLTFGDDLGFYRNRVVQFALLGSTNCQAFVRLSDLPLARMVRWPD